MRRSRGRHPRVRRFLEERIIGHRGGFLLTASLVVLFVVTLVVGWVLLDMIDNNSGLGSGRQIGGGVGFTATVDTATSLRDEVGHPVRQHHSGLLGAASSNSISSTNFRSRTREGFVFRRRRGTSVNWLLQQLLLKLTSSIANGHRCCCLVTAHVASSSRRDTLSPPPVLLGKRSH